MGFRQRSPPARTNLMPNDTFKLDAAESLRYWCGVMRRHRFGQKYLTSYRPEKHMIPSRLNTWDTARTFTPQGEPCPPTVHSPFHIVPPTHVIVTLKRDASRICIPVGEFLFREGANGAQIPSGNSWEDIVETFDALTKALGLIPLVVPNTPTKG